MTSFRNAPPRAAARRDDSDPDALEHLLDLSGLTRRPGRIGGTRLRRRLLRRLGPTLAGRYRRLLRQADRSARTRGAHRLRLRVELELRGVSEALRRAARTADAAERKKKRPLRRPATPRTIVG